MATEEEVPTDEEFTFADDELAAKEELVPTPGGLYSAFVNHHG